MIQYESCQCDNYKNLHLFDTRLTIQSQNINYADGKNSSHDNVKKEETEEAIYIEQYLHLFINPLMEV